MPPPASSDRAPSLALNALSEHDRRVLEVMALVAEPAPRTGWVRWLVSVGVRRAKGQAYSANDLADVFARLMRVNLVYEIVSPLRSHPEYAIGPTRLHQVLSVAQAAGNLNALYQRVARYQASLDDADHNPARQIARDALALMHGCKVDPAKLVARGARGWLKRDVGSALVAVLGRAAPPAGLAVLPEELRASYLRELARGFLEELVPVAPELLSATMADQAANLDVRATLCLARVLTGHATHVLAELKGRSEPHFVAVRAVAYLTEQRLEEARREARAALQSRAESGKAATGVDGVLGLFVWLLTTTDESCDPEWVSAQRRASIGGRDVSTAGAIDALKAFEGVLVDDAWPDSDKLGERSCSALPHGWVEALFWGFAARAAGAKWEHPGAQLYREIARNTEASAPWLSNELRALLETEGTPGGSIAALNRPPAPWERALAQIETALAQGALLEPLGADAEPIERLAWCVSVENGAASLSARMQARSAKGFSSGRRLMWHALAELRNRSDLLIEEDRPVIQALLSNQSSWRGRPLQSEDAALLELVGHPNVFSDLEAREQVEVALGTPRFEVRVHGEHLRISVEPRGCAEGAIYAEQEGRRIVLTALDARQSAIAVSIARSELVVPLSARERVERLVASALASFAVTSDVGAQASAVPCVEADARMHIALFRRAHGLRVRLRVRPLAGGVHFPVAQGAQHVLGLVTAAEGTPRHAQAQRDFDREREQFEQVRAEVEIFAERSWMEDEFSLEDPLVCLELMNQLRLLGERVVVEWPEGQPIQVLAERGARDLHLKLTNADYWLSAHGELRIDDELKLSLRELLALFQKAEGRFIPLDDQRYLALDESLRRELEGLSQFTHEKGKAVLMHPLALQGLSTWAIDIKRFDFDKDVQKRLARVREAQDLWPAVSPLLAAQLRSYQVEGYAWMSRLAHWGAGICLADDMGLGKTLQTLALLLDHASGGPSLVVAPMSVCRNWLDEAARFTPSLRVLQLGTDDRDLTLASLGPNDLLVCSYGVMQQEVERLSALKFRVVVLDEAQAIKNASTRRARGAMQLVGEVRVALTGTPVENHLGEIWSIMTFLNPGLLGGAKDFERRFAKPIQREGDQLQAERLRQIIRPFVLRRKKSQVLEELPEKTVITLEVEPSAEEAALFSLLREQARARIKDPAKAHELRFRLLAEITKMRRAACHPDLVAPAAGLESSKLATLEALTSELREGGHRALVFSQFVDYLTLVRKRLDALGISYQYLDGSTTARKRADAVRAFQMGEGDLFLISLKAGGFGLNLTAADYVIHLDPWWNPAVEDQASDRAHRIGQTRPVTVYRLVMRSTIEQKILSLHDNKREIADRLLEGSEQSEKLSVEDLVTLLRED